MPGRSHHKSSSGWQSSMFGRIPSAYPRTRSSLLHTISCTISAMSKIKFDSLPHTCCFARSYLAGLSSKINLAASARSGGDPAPYLQRIKEVQVHIRRGDLNGAEALLDGIFTSTCHHDRLKHNGNFVSRYVSRFVDGEVRDPRPITGDIQVPRGLWSSLDCEMSPNRLENRQTSRPLRRGGSARHYIGRQDLILP